MNDWSEPAHRSEDERPAHRRRRAAAAESNRELLRAMADALRDILRDERSHAA